MEIYLALAEILKHAGLGMAVTTVVASILFMLINFVFYKQFLSNRKIQPNKDSPGNKLLPCAFPLLKNLPS